MLAEAIAMRKIAMAQVATIANMCLMLHASARSSHLCISYWTSSSTRASKCSFTTRPRRVACKNRRTERARLPPR